MPIDLTCVVFDAIGCLRSALDHAVFSASSVVRGIPEPRNTKFPFGDTYADARKQFKDGASGVPANLRNFLLEFKPYKEGNKTLWGFNRIRNSKIHQALAPIALASQSIAISGVGCIGEFRSINEWDPSKLELTYAKGRNISAGIRIAVNIQLAFGPTTDLPLCLVDSTLSHVAGVVESVIAGLEAECLHASQVS